MCNFGKRRQSGFEQRTPSLYWLVAIQDRSVFGIAMVMWADAKRPSDPEM